jgi:hypothetical protein
VTLRVDDNLVARGRVRAPDGFDSCHSKVTVKIRRDGEVVRKIETRANGRFRVKLPDEHGRYVAVAPQLVVGDSDLCEQAKSRARRI